MFQLSDGVRMKQAKMLCFPVVAALAKGSFRGVVLDKKLVEKLAQLSHGRLSYF